MIILPAVLRRTPQGARGSTGGLCIQGQTVMAQKKIVHLFIDSQNMYKGARRAFGDTEYSGHVEGQFWPMKMGELLCSKQSKGDPPRELGGVHIYTGQPSNRRNPKGYAANRRQVAAWERSGVRVVHRPLKYSGDPNEKPREKGIDVSLAIDFITYALDGHYTVGIIASTDTDLVPALEFVMSRTPEEIQVEVTSWQYPYGSSPHLSSPTGYIPWRAITQPEYLSIADRTDYNIKK